MLAGRGHAGVSRGHGNTPYVDHDGGDMTPMLIFVQWRLVRVTPTTKCISNPSQRQGHGVWTGTQASTAGQGTRQLPGDRRPQDMIVGRMNERMASIISHGKHARSVERGRKWEMKRDGPRVNEPQVSTDLSNLGDGGELGDRDCNASPCFGDKLICPGFGERGSMFPRHPTGRAASSDFRGRGDGGLIAVSITPELNVN